MIKKIITIYALIAFVSLGLFVTSVLAKDKNDEEQILPTEEGTYDVPGHPGMKVRVFVHNAKPGKPAPGPSSSLSCGLSDPDGDAVVAGAGWRIPEGDWTYRVNPEVPSVIGTNLSAIINNSFAAWTGNFTSTSTVNLINGGTTLVKRAVRDGQNIIAWGRTSGTALGTTYIWYQNGVAIELDTIMNQKFSWSWADQASYPYPQCAYTNVYDAQNILTHELGHWFGLDDEYTAEYQNHTMYGYGSKMEVKKDTLTTGDISGLQTLYP